MTETLHRPDTNLEHKSSSAEHDALEAKLALEYDQDEEALTSQIENQPEISPMASRIRNAAERFANLLEKRSVNKAHDEALKEYRKRDIGDYSTHIDSLSKSDEPYAEDFARLQRKEDRINDREVLIAAGKEKLRYIGAIAAAAAIETSKVVGDTAKGVGKIVKTEAEYKFNDIRLKHSNDRLTKQFRRNYEKETKSFDKRAEKASRKLDRTDRKEVKRAVREDKRFERSLRNKARVEKVVNTLERGAVRAVYTKRRLGAAATRFQNIGRGDTEYVPRAKRTVK